MLCHACLSPAASPRGDSDGEMGKAKLTMAEEEQGTEPMEEAPPAAIPDPEHPCLAMVSGGDTEIGGGKLWRRRLVTMVKTREP